MLPSLSLYRSFIAGYIYGAENAVCGRSFFTMMDFLLANFGDLHQALTGLRALAFVWASGMSWCHTSSIKWALPYQTSVILVPRSDAAVQQQSQEKAKVH